VHYPAVVAEYKAKVFFSVGMELCVVPRSFS